MLTNSMPSGPYKRGRHRMVGGRHVLHNTRMKARVPLATRQHTADIRARGKDAPGNRRRAYEARMKKPWSEYDRTKLVSADELV